MFAASEGYQQFIAFFALIGIVSTALFLRKNNKEQLRAKAAALTDDELDEQLEVAPKEKKWDYWHVLRGESNLRATRAQARTLTDDELDEQMEASLKGEHTGTYRELLKEKHSRRGAAEAGKPLRAEPPLEQVKDPFEPKVQQMTDDELHAAVAIAQQELERRRTE